MPLPDWDRAYGAPLFAATIRSTPADFQVTEELGYAFSGDGEHDYVYLEKLGANTEWVARQLARFADVPARDVGFSGLKDRHAITRQWFSVPHLNGPDWSQLSVEGVRIEDVQRHSRKLRRGAHKANHFQIVLRGDDLLGTTEILQKRLDTIRAEGVPNYFGEQRFGRDANNLALADAWAAGKRLPRHKRSIAISCVRSFLFNERLSARVQQGTWNTLVAGDIANLDGTASVFNVDVPDADLVRRCCELDIHPSGELVGEGSAGTHDAWQAALDKARVKPGWRSLRLRVREFTCDADEHAVTLTFSLGRGAFATSVLREIADARASLA